MATKIKNLAAGTLKLSSASFTVGERILYAAPNPDETYELKAEKGPRRAAMITSIRIFNAEPTSGGVRNFNLFFVRFNQDKSILPENRTKVQLVGTASNGNGEALAWRELRVFSTPLVLEEGDLLVGHTASITPANIIQYLVSGIERDV